ncbi:MAG: carboxypeptidase regulatory-like domain-containing protein [Gemmatimonadaceae bacterium]|nr:carboxypeptidase regulatory-like domain-containing protein [Gemmatimonadaceae bacterium]
MTIRRFLFVVAAALIPMVPPNDANAQQADVIRGRVTGPDSAAIENVVVTVTSISGNVSRTARTDRSGRFTITFPGGEGDYMVSFAALGYAARRFEVKRSADEEILVADTKLSRVGAILDPVMVTAERQKVQRNDAPPDVSGTERPLSNSAVPANLMGDLAAMAASLPGVQSVPGQDGAADGYSVLGLGADQNNTTLNGMQFGGSSLPRDASVASSVITSPYDVSRGGFSGAQMSLRTRSGSNFLTRGMSLNVDAPQMQWSDRAAQSLGQKYSNVSLGGTVSGPLKYDKAFYNVAYQLGRRANNLQTLLNTDSRGLQAVGVSSDSVARLISILNGERVPLTTDAIPGDRVGDQGSLFGSFDFAPPSSTTGQALNLSFNGNWNRQSPSSGFATELPAHSGDRTTWRGGVQARQNMYVRGLLSETSLGYSASRSWANPYLDMPTGAVRVNSSFDDGASGVQNLVFGGNQAMNSTQTTGSAALLNQLSWFSTNNKHRVKLTSELRRDGTVQEQASNLLGTFSFNSLADLQAARPVSFTRQLGSRERDVSQLVAGLSLGDSWRRTDNLQIQYGLRVDGNRFLADPALNPGVESVFGVRNDPVPGRLYVSPRMGFSWSYGRAPQIAGFEGAARGPRAVVRGGIGVFRNTPSANLVGVALDNTGLASGVQQITCIGMAAPVPDWNAYAANTASVPARCADGSTGSVFSSGAPNVTLFANDFSAPRSVRSNLQWSGPVLGNRFSAQLEGTYSLNLNQSGPMDLNFNPVTRFTLAGEDNRPVFVQPTSIFPATGVASPLDARLSQSFSRVTQLTSDLESQSRQVSLRLSPNTFSTNLSWSLSYVYSNVREQFRGFSSTVSNPLAVEWGRSSFDSRNQLVYNVGYNFFDFVRVNWFGQFRSGSPYTPMVAGDINGDGYANDRAFIPSLSDSDPALVSSVKSLLDNTSAEARSCLRKQLGTLAGRNSCQGPWFSSASMSVSFNPLKVRMPQRATLSFQLSNPLGAADLITHGSSNLRGWGQPSLPDQQLLYVRGFDPQTRRYKYEVNQRFGSTNQGVGSFRLPVTLTAMMRFDVGPTRERQMLTQQLDRGRRTEGTRAPEMMLKAIYGNGGIPNPLATILRQQDSLRLSGPQADSLATLNRIYTIRNDALWSPLTKYFAELPNGYDKDEAYDRYMSARKATIDLLARLAPGIKGLLTAEQRRKLPPFIASYLEPRYLASIRSGTAGFTGSSMFGAGAPVMMSSDMMVPGMGGGTQTIIIHR